MMSKLSKPSHQFTSLCFPGPGVEIPLLKSNEFLITLVGIHLVWSIARVLDMGHSANDSCLVKDSIAQRASGVIRLVF